MTDRLPRSMVLPTIQRDIRVGEDTSSLPSKWGRALVDSLREDHTLLVDRIEELTMDGVFADRPDPTGGGRFFYSTDTDALYYDDGSWDLVGGTSLTTDYINVKEYGAKGDGTTDDTDAIQDALDYSDANKGTVYFPIGIYKISSTLMTYDNTHIFGHTNIQSDMDWTNDWKEWTPTYADHASIIQFALGSHGSIFETDGSTDDGVIIDGMTLRVGQERTSTDMVYAEPPRRTHLWNCRIENFTTGLQCPSTYQTLFAPKIRWCWFIACLTGVGGGSGGVIVDAVFDTNQFTACTDCIYMSDGSSSRIHGNRFEWSGNGVYLNDYKRLYITANEFDSNNIGVYLREGTRAITISGNLFKRNGKNGVTQARSHIFIHSSPSDQVTGIAIVGNAFVYGKDDEGGTRPRPYHIIEFQNCDDCNVIFKGNDTHSACISEPFLDLYNNSNNFLDIDSVDLYGFLISGTTYAGDPNGPADVLSNAMTDLNRMMILGNYCQVRLWDDRRCITNMVASQVYFVGVPATPVILLNNTYTMTLDRVHNVELANITPTDYEGATYAAIAPDGLGDGKWRTGKHIFDSAPVETSDIGWFYDGSNWQPWGSNGYYSDTFWEDLRVPASSIKPGSASPTWATFKDGTNTWHFSKVSDNEVEFSAQLPHAYKEGTDIYPHVHWSPTDTDTGNVVWKLEYTWANFEGTFPSTTTISVTDAADGTSHKHQIAILPTITGTSKTVSSMIICRLYRDVSAPDDYDNSAALLEFDFHFERDSAGSDEEYVK